MLILKLQRIFKSRILVFFLFAFQFLTLELYAQPPAYTGCLMGDGTFLTLYQETTRLGSDYRYKYYTTPSYKTVCTNNASQYIKLVRTLNYPSYNINCGTSDNYRQNLGVMYYYSPINCPIDDYIPLMLLAVGASGFFFIRKRSSLLGSFGL